MGGAGGCVKYLERRWNRKEGKGTKILKRWGKLGQGVGALKRGAGTPSQTMATESVTSTHLSMLSS